MIPLPELKSYPPIEFPRFKWLLDRGVPIHTLIRLLPFPVATGIKAHDSRFDDDPEGQPFLVFEEAEDCIYWQPKTGELATWNGRAFALGEDNIWNSGTYASDCNLDILSDPLSWMRNRCHGIVVLDWTRAFDRLRDVPRIAVEELLLITFKANMKPRHMPAVSVLTNARKAAA